MLLITAPPIRQVIFIIACVEYNYKQIKKIAQKQGFSPTLFEETLPIDYLRICGMIIMYQYVPQNRHPK